MPNGEGRSQRACFDKGALRVLEGREKGTCPGRDVDSAVPGNALLLRPKGEYAGAERPTAVQTTSGNPLTAFQKMVWDG